MPPSDTRKRRTYREWVGRGLLACAVAVLAFQSVTFSVAQVMAGTNPTLADAVVSYDGRLKAAHAGALIVPNATAHDRSKADALSRDALDLDPTTVIAVTTLGLNTAVDGDTRRARRLLDYAQMLSRRNVKTQLWSIEEAVARGNVADALRWYDIALRTEPKMSDVLFPVLTQAMRDPKIRVALVRTLCKKPLWASNYIKYVAEQNDPETAAALFLDLRRRGLEVAEPWHAAVIDGLINTGKPDQGWAYYATLHPDADRRHARDPHFGALLVSPSQFDWTPVNDGSIATSIQRTDRGGAFEFEAPTSLGGAALRQLQLLPPGAYHFVASGSDNGPASGAHPYWTLVCRGDGRELGHVAMSDPGQAGDVFAGTIVVPPGCPVQVLTLFVSPSDAIGGISGRINRVVLEPRA